MGEQFIQWLCRQTSRNDAVGDLAREWTRPEKGRRVFLIPASFYDEWSRSTAHAA
jgi:hypothetical protein